MRLPARQIRRLRRKPAHHKTAKGEREEAIAAPPVWCVFASVRHDIAVELIRTRLRFTVQGTSVSIMNGALEINAGQRINQSTLGERWKPKRWLRRSR